MHTRKTPLGIGILFSRFVRREWRIVPLLVGPYASAALAHKQ